MNGEHMVAGSEENKRQDFTVNSIQGWELIMTKLSAELGFQESWKSCGGGRKGYWNLETHQEEFVGVTGHNITGLCKAWHPN